jgi:hypothetical protein
VRRVSLKQKLLVAVQVLALALMQLSGAVSVLKSGRGHAGPRVIGCAGDHDECGCAPERVASRTCCCFQKGFQEVPSCCEGSDRVDVQTGAQVSKAGEGRSAPGWYVAPCGGAAKFLEPSTEFPDFCVPSRAVVALKGGFPVILPSRAEAPFTRFPEPPDPPPKVFPIA